MHGIKTARTKFQNSKQVHEIGDYPTRWMQDLLRFFKIPMSENDNFRYFKMPMSVCLTVGFFESVGKLPFETAYKTAYKTAFSGC